MAREFEGRFDMKGRIHRAPLALTSDGTVVANLAHFDTLEDAQAALRQALELGRQVFISVALTPEEVAFVRKRIDDSGAETLAWLLGKERDAKRKKTPRKKDDKNVDKPSGNQTPMRATVRRSRSTDP